MIPKNFTQSTQKYFIQNTESSKYFKTSYKHLVNCDAVFNDHKIKGFHCDLIMRNKQHKDNHKFLVSKKI